MVCVIVGVRYWLEVGKVFNGVYCYLCDNLCQVDVFG